MSGRYERVRGFWTLILESTAPSNNLQVNARDDDEPETPSAPLPRPTYPIPNSPPPSFHSRASSRDRSNRVNHDLADAFDADGDDSDDEADDTRRLVRGSNNVDAAQAPATAPQMGGGQSTQSQPRPAGAVPTTTRVYGGGIQSDGVFSNLSARPEAGGGEKEELPPVSSSVLHVQRPSF